MVTVRYFAAAAEAAGATSESVDAATVPELVSALSLAHGAEFEAVLGRCSLLVDGRRVAPDAQAELANGVTVDVLPPFAGG